MCLVLMNFLFFFVLQCANSTLTDEFPADENLLETCVNQPEEIEPTEDVKPAEKVTLSHLAWVVVLKS